MLNAAEVYRVCSSQGYYGILYYAIDFKLEGTLCRVKHKGKNQIKVHALIPEQNPELKKGQEKVQAKMSEAVRTGRTAAKL